MVSQIYFWMRNNVNLQLGQELLRAVGHAKTVAFREMNQRIHELERNTEARFSDQQRNLLSQ